VSRRISDDVEGGGRAGFDRRAAFFVVAAIVCVALTPIAEAAYAWVCLGLGGVYLVLALASYLDARTRARTQ
jgi:hypothetical protein